MKQSLHRLGQEDKQLHDENHEKGGLINSYRLFLSNNFSKVFLTLLSLLFGQLSFAQKVISGTVASSEGEMLPGVTVLIKGTTTGTITDLDGRFKLEAPETSDDVIIFSYVGFETLEVPIGNQAVFSISLKEDVASLEEVVVVGYGTQKRSEITSAVSSVSSEDFMIGKIQDASDLVKGKIAGLVMTKGSGDPNATSSIMLRGITSLEGGTTPLILIDGVAGDMTSVTPESIESVSVLKDASSAAIYGTRGANGVILITTKKGMRDRPAKVTYTGYGTLSDFYKTPDFMGPSDIRRGKTSFSDGGYDTDWLGAVTQTGYTHKHVLDIQGGTKGTVYSANVGYKYEEGTIKKSDNDQLKVQLNLDQFFFNDKVQVGVKLWKTYQKNTANTASSDDLRNVYRQAIIHNPTSPIYNEDGTYYEEWNRYQYYNPVELLNELQGKNETERTYMIGTMSVEPIKNWKTKLLVSDNLYNRNYSSYATSDYYSSQTSGFLGSAYKEYKNEKRRALELTSEYRMDLEKHAFTALGGYSYYYNVYEGFSASNRDFPTDAYSYNNLEQGSLLREGQAGMGSYKNDNTLISVFGRVFYGYMDRYNVSASVRREGSSKFGKNHQWGTFPAVSASWTISNEAFLKSVGWIDNLKLRAGYGETGRIANDAYQSLVLYDYDANYGNFVDSNGNWVSSLAPSQNSNPDLHWETSKEVNIGVDLAFFNSRVNASVNVYNKKTTGLLGYYNVPAPPNLNNTTLANGGSLRNRGIEVMLSGVPVKTRDFSWNTTLTASRNINKMISLSNDLYESDTYRNVGGVGDPISVTTHRIEEGESLANYWGLKSVGVTEDGIWLIEDPTTGEAMPYSTSLNSDDYRQYLGNGLPKVYMGWNNTFQYKKFDLGVQMSGQFGFKILNQQRMFYENNSIQYNRLKSAADPVYGITPLSSSQAQAFVSYYLEKGDFLKVDNATLGYSLNFNNDYIDKIRVYCSAQNFLMITDYKGLDPELSNSDAEGAGNDSRDKYPTIRSFTLGVNVTFK